MKAFLLVLAFFSLAFSTSDNGVIGTNIVTALADMLKDNTVAASIYTALAGLIGIGLRILLKRIPTSMHGIASIILWKIAAFLFGDGVVLEKHTDPEYVKAQLIKKYPLLQIDIKKLGN